MPEPGESVEATIGELVELEEELKTIDGTAGGNFDVGTIAGVSKVGAADVPEGYPVPIETTYALHIDVDTDGGSVPVFIEWPDDGETSDHLEALLDALGRSPDEFANIYGDRIALDVEDGWHGIDAERTAALQGAGAQGGGGLGDAVAGTAAAATDLANDPVHLGLVALVLGAGLSFASLDTALGGVGSVVMLLAWPGIPAGIYYDLARVEAETDWDSSPGAWALASVVPILNVAVGAVYLVERHVRVQGHSKEEGASVWLWTILVAVLMPIAALPLGVLSLDIAVSLFLYGPLITPLAVYMDCEYVAAVSEWEPLGEGWAVIAFVVPVLGGGAYLVRRATAMV